MELVLNITKNMYYHSINISKMHEAYKGNDSNKNE